MYTRIHHIHGHLRLFSFHPMQLEIKEKQEDSIIWMEFTIAVL
jgi:hypothetical protein